MVDQIELRYNARTLLFALLALVPFAAVGVMLLAFGHDAAPVIGVIALSLSALMLIAILLSVIRRKPALTLSADGICAPAAGVFSRGRWRREPVPWSEISAIVVFPYSSGFLPGLRAIGFQATDPNGRFWAKRRTMRLNQALTGYPIVLMASQLSVTPEELVELLRRFKSSITLGAGSERTFVPNPLEWYPRPKER